MEKFEGKILIEEAEYFTLLRYKKMYLNFIHYRTGIAVAEMTTEEVKNTRLLNFDAEDIENGIEIKLEGGKNFDRKERN